MEKKNEHEVEVKLVTGEVATVWVYTPHKTNYKSEVISALFSTKTVKSWSGAFYYATRHIVSASIRNRGEYR